MCGWIEKITDTGVPVSLKHEIYSLPVQIPSVFLTEVKNKILFCLFQNLSALNWIGGRFEQWGIPQAWRTWILWLQSPQNWILSGKHIWYPFKVSWAIWVTLNVTKRSEKQIKSLVQNKLIGPSTPYSPIPNELLGREYFYICGWGSVWTDTWSEKMEHGFGSPESWSLVLALLWLWYLSKAFPWVGFSFYHLCSRAVDALWVCVGKHCSFV